MESSQILIAGIGGLGCTWASRAHARGGGASLLMIDAELRNNDLVSISQEGLTHKQISKGRKGRRITKKLQLKILSAWNQLMSTDLVLGDLFNYRGR